MCRNKDFLTSNHSLASSLLSSLVDSLHHRQTSLQEVLHAMEPLLSAVVSDFFSRALSMVIQKYWQPKGAEEKLQRLQRVLLRIDTTVEEAEGRHITNQAMLQQLKMLREGMYRGYYMLDTFVYRGHEDKADDEEVSARSFAFSRFNPSKRLLFPVLSTQNMDIVLDVGTMKKLEKMVDGLEKMMGDMEEFVMFLDSYPRICRQPYSAYLVLDKIMFGRQMEKETIVSFLLRREAVGNGNLGVLPIIGAARVGKSTLVEHVCLDERVRNHFSSIVFLRGDDLNGGNVAALRGSCVIKHEILPPTSHGKSLVVIELTGDMDEETWRMLYSSGVKHMAHGSKIIITSRSEKVVAFGTTQALKLEFLPREAYWYFFKAVAFGSANPDDQPKLASLGMEIAVLLNRSFMSANVVGSLLRANLDAQFWRKVLGCLREFTSKHLLLFGEHPTELILKDRPVYLWTMAKTSNVVMIRHIYQECSPRNDVPRITAQDVLSRSVTCQGRFQAVAWRSRIPPCYTYLVSCVSQTAEHTVLSRKRSRQERI